MKKLLFLLLLALNGCRCMCNYDTDKLLAELGNRYAEELAELDRRYADRQLEWELRCELEAPPAWSVIQWHWQWPLTLQWQWLPSWYRCQWHVPIAEDADTPKNVPERVEPGPCPESPEPPYLPPPEREGVRRLALNYLKAGKDEYEQGYFEEALNYFCKARAYQKYLTVTEREELEDFINKTWQK